MLLNKETKQNQKAWKRERIETIQTTAVLKISKNALKSSGDLRRLCRLLDSSKNHLWELV